MVRQWTKCDGGGLTDSQCGSRAPPEDGAIIFRSNHGPFFFFPLSFRPLDYPVLLTSVMQNISEYDTVREWKYGILPSTVLAAKT